MFSVHVNLIDYVNKMEIDVKNNLLLIYPGILLGIAFWKSKIAKKGEFSECMWDKEQSKMLQAIACIGVVLHHMTQEITQYGDIDKGPITVFSNIGILFTAVFFFFSGYGLIVSVREKEDYLEHFLSHRLPIILVPFYLANVIQILVRIYVKRIPLKGKELFQCLTGYVLVNDNGWYIVEIFFLYIFFYILFKLIRKQDIAIAFYCIATIWIILLGYQNGHDYSTIGGHWFMGEWWFNSTGTFIMGILVARFKERIIMFTKKHYWLLLVLTLLLFVIAFRFEEHIRITRGYYRESFQIGGISNKAATFWAQTILCLISTWLVLLVNMKVALKSRLLKAIGVISLEIFLIHGMFLKQIFDITRMNPIGGYALILGCGIASAVLLHFAGAPIISMFQYLGKKNDFTRECAPDLFREKRNRRRKRIQIAVLCLIVGSVLTIGIWSGYSKWIRDPSIYRSEMKALYESEVGDTVYWGRFESDYYIPGKEKVSWIVLKKEKYRVMLVAEKGIAGAAYHQAHSEVDWENSDLRHYLNHNLYESMFNDNEKKMILDHPDTGDRLSLLSVKEADSFFESQESRQIALTEAAIKDGTNLNSESKANNWDVKGYRSSWWWLRGTGKKKLTAPIVSENGEIETDKKYVNKPNGAVRPVVWVKLE